MDCERYDYVRFALADMHGRSRGRLVPARHFENYLQKGVNLWGGVLVFSLSNSIVPVSTSDPQFRAVPLAVASPCEETLHDVPWSGGAKFKVAEVICESYWLKDRSRQMACPRYVARRQLENLECCGYSLLSGFEMEFLLQDFQDTFENGCDYMNHRRHAKHDDFLFELERQMFQAGVDIENLHSEHDTGVFETIIKAAVGIKCPDSTFTFKTGLLEFADKRSCSIKFNSEPGKRSIAMHFNHSLWSLSEERNVFINESDSDDISEVAKHWIAGLLRHAKALTAFYCPTVNCYQRLHKPRRAGPVFWGFDESSAVVKAKLYSSDKGPYLEHRVPSGMSNPYLILAVTVAAGMDGMVKKLECPSPGMNTNVDHLPGSLQEAVEELQADKELIESLGQEFVDWFVNVVQNDLKEC